MLPVFIPYIIKEVSYINKDTGKEKGGSFEKSFDLFYIPEGKIIKLPFLINKAYYVDDSLVSSTALILERRENDGETMYTVVNTMDDLDSPLWFDYLKVMTPQLILVRKDDKWGIINDKLQIRRFFEYDSLEEYVYLKDNVLFLVVTKNGKSGLLNEDLSEKFPLKFSSISCNSKLGIFVLQGDTSTTVFDVENNNITGFPFLITSIKDINEGCIVVERNKKYCVYDTDMQKFITDKWFNNIDTFQYGFSLCDKRFILYRDGRIVDLGEACYDRKGEIIYSTYHLHDDVWGISIFRREKFLCKIIHDKGSRGIFYHHIIDDKYLVVGSHNMKYCTNTPQAIYDFEGNLLPISIMNDFPKENKKDTTKIESGYWAKKRSMAHKMEYVVEDIEEFENKHFKKSKYLSSWDDYELIELQPNLLRLKTMSVDAEFGCDWSLIGYIYNGIKLWADINISND